MIMRWVFKQLHPVCTLKWINFSWKVDGNMISIYWYFVQCWARCIFEMHFENIHWQLISSEKQQLSIVFTWTICIREVIIIWFQTMSNFPIKIYYLLLNLRHYRINLDKETIIDKIRSHLSILAATERFLRVASICSFVTTPLWGPFY